MHYIHPYGHVLIHLRRPATNGMIQRSPALTSQIANPPWLVTSKLASPRASSSLSVLEVQLDKSDSPRIPRQNPSPHRSGTYSSAEAVQHVPLEMLFLTGKSHLYYFIERTPCLTSTIVASIDLDIESGTPAHYAAFVKKIRSLAAPTGKR